MRLLLCYGDANLPSFQLCLLCQVNACQDKVASRPDLPTVNGGYISMYHAALFTCTKKLEHKTIHKS